MTLLNWAMFAGYALLLGADACVTFARVARFGPAAELNPVIKHAVERFGHFWGIVLGFLPYSLVGLMLAQWPVALAFYSGILARNVLGALLSKKLESEMKKYGLTLNS